MSTTYLSHGDDTQDYRSETSGVDIQALQGDDTVNGSHKADNISAGAGDDFIKGEAGDDNINGGAGDDVLRGNRGDDVLSGAAGDDTLEGGTGADSLKGGRGNDTLLGDEDDILLTGGKGFDILKVNDTDGDNIVDVDLSASNIRGIEALVGDFDRVDGNVTNATINLNQILHSSQDDGDSMTPETDNTFLAVGIDSLNISGIHRWDNDDSDLEVNVVELDDAAEAAYLEMLGISRSVNLYSYSFTKDTGESVTIVTDLDIEDIQNGDNGSDLIDSSMYGI